jgi:hypothetical protein
LAFTGWIANILTLFFAADKRTATTDPHLSVIPWYTRTTFGVSLSAKGIKLLTKTVDFQSVCKVCATEKNVTKIFVRNTPIGRIERKSFEEKLLRFQDKKLVVY